MTERREQAMELEERHRLRVVVRRELDRPARDLTFAPELEARFETVTGQARVRHLVRCGIVGMVLSNGFVLSDLKLIPDAMAYALVLHFCIFTPLCSAGVFYVARNPTPWRRETVYTACVAVLLLGAFGLFWLSRVPQSGYLSTTFALYITFVNIVVRLRFAWCLGFSIGSTVLASAAILLRGGLPDGVPLTLVLTTFATALYTLYAAYVIERAERRDYLLMLEQQLDVGELADANATLNHLSSIDALTGIANRRTFETRIAQAWLSSRTVALLMIDVDHFKSYNDHHGHPAGDACLVHLAAIMDQHLRTGHDLLARYGGEEFAVILPGMDGEAATCVAQRIRCAVEEWALPHGGPNAGPIVTISIGVAVAKAATTELPPSLIEAADKALYFGKRAGRNCVHVIEPSCAPVELEQRLVA